MLSPLEDEPAVEDLLEPIPLTPEQTTAQAEADERDRQRQREWALVVQALNDNSLAVVRAMRRFRSETEQEQVERVLTSYEAGSFLIDRLGAGLVIDRDLAVVLLDLRCPLFRGKVSDPPGSRARYIEADHERAVRSSP